MPASESRLLFCDLVEPEKEQRPAASAFQKWQEKEPVCKKEQRFVLYC
jgi:hypothetical protein